MPSIPFKSEAEWLALRESHVGGSDVASLFYEWLLPDRTVRAFHMFEETPPGAVMLGCVSPYKTGFRLFNEKLGILMPEDLTGERIAAGQFLEPALAAWAMDKWKWRLRKVRRYLEHDAIPGWGASLDYEVHEEGALGAPAEFKNVDFLVFRDQWHEDDESDDIASPPLHINLQLQSQIGTTKADHGWITVCVGGNKLKRGRIDRHEATQQRIGEAVTAFWKAVREQQLPFAHADFDTVKEIYAGQSPREGDLDLTGQPAVDALCRRFLRWNDHLKFAKEFTDGLKARIGVLMKEHRAFKSDRYRVTWPIINREEKMIPARLQKALTYRGGMAVKERKDG